MKEVWSPLPGYGSNYAVSSIGRVKRIRSGNGAKVGRILNLQTQHSGYLTVILSFGGKQARRSIHSLVVDTFLPGKRGSLQVNHKNGDKKDNRVENLELVTRRQNMDHAIENGLSGKPWKRGGKVNKLNEKDVRNIRNRIDSGEAMQSIADDYGVVRGTIYCIKRGKTWGHVT